MKPKTVTWPSPTLKDSHMAKSISHGKFTSSMEEKRKGLYLTVVKSATRKNLVSLFDFFHNSYIS